MKNILDLSLIEVRDKIRSGELTSEAVTIACLEQIEKIHAFATAQKVEFSTAPDALKVKITASKGQNLFLNYIDYNFY
mgnify:CR=1 FL=1